MFYHGMMYNDNVQIIKLIYLNFNWGIIFGHLDFGTYLAIVRTVKTLKTDSYQHDWK